jgi:integrase
MARANPFADVEPVGQRRAGRDKPQLRRDEARALTGYCLAQCSPVVRPEAVAVLAAWLLGTRAAELVVQRDVRDLDDGGKLLVIPSGKTKRAERDIEIPDVLRPLLLELAKGRGGTEPLFIADDAPTAKRKLGPRRATRHWLYYHCRKMCEAAGVPVVSPHGLRRTHVSIARGAGATAHLVAEQVGHGSVQVQERSYAAPGAAAQGQRERVLKVIAGGKR